MLPTEAAQLLLADVVGYLKPGLQRCISFDNRTKIPVRGDELRGCLIGKNHAYAEASCLFEQDGKLLGDHALPFINDENGSGRAVFYRSCGNKEQGCYKPSDFARN